MKNLSSWKLARRTGAGVELEVEGAHSLSIRILEEALIRVTLRRNGTYRLGRTWAVAPEGEVPWQGRDREDLSGFSCPGFQIDETDGLSLSTRHLKVTVTEPLALTWHCRENEGATWRLLAGDRPASAYMLGRKDHRNHHYLRRLDGDRYYGLGEKSGRLERSDRRFEMRNLDALGYNAAITDPLYKHVPFTITETADAGVYGLYYDTLAGCWFDLGNEKDNYYPAFRSFRAEDGDLDYYLSWAPDMLGVVKRQHSLIGGTAFMPRWGLGYSGSSMAYTDAADAQVQVTGFLSKLETEDMPCDSFQMSSGYTMIDGKRYVFNWDRSRFPDVDTMAARFRDAQVHLIANIKPVMLTDHPLYKEAEAGGLFVRDSETGGPERSPFWDGYGSHLDFTNADTVAFWQGHVNTALFDHGIMSTWNDNNEFEVWDDEAQCAGYGEPIDISLIRPLHGMLMTRASFEAQKRREPEKRPYLISRSAASGTQRYAQTWTGDNHTSWNTLRWNIPMGLGLSLSGFYNIGHDVGGFVGPRPDPELFLRWVQNGIFHPRFTIHSWNDDGSVNEAWMHPEITPLVRDALKLRYRLLPYLYTQLYRAVMEGEPMLRPLLLDYPDDPACRDAEFDFLLGPDLLVASVVEEGAIHRDVTLPDCAEGWWEFGTDRWHPGGQVLTVPVTLSSIPLFVRGGAVLPLAGNTSRAAADTDTSRGWQVYPPAGGSGPLRSVAYDDDGTAVDALEGNHCLTRFELGKDERGLRLDWTRQGTWQPAFEEVTIEVASGEDVNVNGVSMPSGTRIPFDRSTSGKGN
jgi:alpha-glucosidase